MFEWLKKNVEICGSVVFPGALAPRPENLDHLRSTGIDVERLPDGEEMHWVMALRHPDWGEAMLASPRNIPAPPRELIEFDVGLTPPEKEELLRLGGSVLSLRMEGKKNNVLADRKNALRFLHAVMADDGLAVVDHVASSIWSRPALEDEMCHDADLDVGGIYALHAVAPDDAADMQQDEEGPPIIWLHTHGLAEIGFFDFDILHPSPDLLGPGVDTLRAIAFAIVEGAVTASTPEFELAYPGGAVRFVPTAAYTRSIC